MIIKQESCWISNQGGPKSKKEPLILLTAPVKHSNRSTDSEWMWIDFRASFLTGWTLFLLAEKQDTGAKRRATFHHGFVIKRNPLATNHAQTRTHTASTRARCWCSFFLAAWANNRPVYFFTVCTTASRPGSCYSGEWLFFPVVCGNNGTQRPILHSDRGLLFLATARAAQDISQSFGCLWSAEPRVHLGRVFFSVCFQELDAY